MAQPSIEDVHVDQVLTNISVAYLQSQEHFIAGKVFPTIPVDKKSDKYYTYTKADWFRDVAQRRADATESAGSGYGLSTATYSCDVFAFHKDIGDQTRANADSPLATDKDGTEFVTRIVLLRKERQWVTDYFGTSIWATDKTGGTDFTVWSDYGGSDPIEDVEDGKETILKTTGFEPNTLVVAYQVWRKMKNHPDFLNRTQYTSSESITPEVVARLLELERVFICKSVYESANEGETSSMAFTTGKHALLCYVPPAPGLLIPSAGYRFAWKGVSSGLGETIGTSRIRLPTKKADRIEAEIAFDDKVVATDLGYFFSGAVS